MKTQNLVSKSTLLYFKSSPYINSRELRNNRKFYLFLNSVSVPTYESHHPTDPLLDELKSLLVKPPVFRLSRITEKARYLMGKVQRRFTTPKVLRDDIPPGIAKKRPIRLINPDKVIGVFYEHNNKLH